jgi:hypothetical protein
MRMSVTFAAAILSAIVLTAAWSISMLPRARDVAATNQTPISSEWSPKRIMPPKR